ncbi:MAG: hypothetical protein DRH26_01020 [Deltaproteobacteria bacterium]|nr:MAG: hypothetical protein DRH26_01020 [Deltaproteobacteria bacterium]
MAVSLSGMTLHTDNDNETWSGTDDPDDYNNAIQGSNSESWQVSKNATETGTLTKSSALPTTRGLFMFWMSSNLAPYYTDIELVLESSSGNDKTFTVATAANKAIGGNFVASVVDFINKGVESGTFAPASFSELAIILDNSASGNIRSVINNWIDAMYFGVGHTISGTTAGDLLFKEAAAVDQLTANQYGILQNYNDIIYSQGDIDCAGTNLVSDSETLVFVDTINGYDTYNFDITGTVSFKNTTIIAAGAIDFILDAESATSFSMVGGALTGAEDVRLKDGQTFSGVVLNTAQAGTIANDPSGCTWNAPGLITVSATGSLNGCTLNDPSGAVAVDISSLNRLDGCTFNSDGTGHAIDLGTVDADTSMSWNCPTSGYASSDGSTGNEVILVNVTAGNTLTVNVSGVAYPTVYNTGSGTVYMPLATYSLSFSGIPSGVEYRLRQGSYNLQHQQDVTTGITAVFQYEYTEDYPVTVSFTGAGIIDSKTFSVMLSNSDQIIPVIFDPDPSYIA